MLQSRIATFCRMLSSLPSARKALPLGPGLNEFLRKPSHVQTDPEAPSCITDDPEGKPKVFFEIHGCQMNNSDAEVCWSVLKGAGYVQTKELTHADVVLILTCAIRDSAEAKIWKRLEGLSKLNRFRQASKTKAPFKVGVLGCMAERLKEKLLTNDKLAHLVAGPDAYRDLPKLLEEVRSGQPAVNVFLSKEETYADITPVHLTDSPATAFVSIQRGCDNFCSFCIVPFVRGRERSRPISSIVSELKLLSEKGVKEVTLLGQNVNSYRDTSMEAGDATSSGSSIVSGFHTLYKPRKEGISFARLLEAAADVDPEMRIRFQSPHPKDFPLEVIQLIRDRPNICKQIHLPAQSGSSSVLKRMRRGYSREAYLELVERIREVVPGISFTSDIIAGFCGETEEDHQDTLDLMRRVKYSVVYSYPYSPRGGTTAEKRFADDVPHEVKIRRAAEINETFREISLKLNVDLIGSRQLVLVEKDSKKSPDDFEGRMDNGMKAIFSKRAEIPVSPGEYAEVLVKQATSRTVKADLVRKSSIQQFFSTGSNSIR